MSSEKPLLMRENVECSYDELYSFIRDIRGDSGILHEQALPRFTSLRERAWAVPLVFIYGGGLLPSAMHPWRLCEVSRCYFPVHNHLKQTGRTLVGTTIEKRSHIVLTEEQGGSDLCSEEVAVMASRVELVGTVFSIEVYQIVGKTEATLGNCVKLEQYDKPLGSSILRIITNEGGLPTDEGTAAQRISQASKDQLRDSFFNTFIPLLGVTLDQLEKKWCDCLTGTLSYSDLDSGGVSSITHSFNDINEEICLIPPDIRLELPRYDVSSAIASDARNIQDFSHDTNCLYQKSEPWVCSTSSISSGTTPTSTDLSLRWSALLSLFEQEERYRVDVLGAWTRWTDGWDDISRFAVVNSMDDIISSHGGSRDAAHVSTVYLDVFLCRSQRVIRDSTYFSGVLLACAMLGCKQVDRFFPPIKSFLRCLRPESRITEGEFLRYEMHVLDTLDFCLQPVTASEIVEMLLHLCNGPSIERNMKIMQRCSDSKQWEYPSSATTTTSTMSLLTHTGYSNSGELERDDEGLRWADFQRVARLLADVMLRETRALAHRPPAIALAIVAVAAAAARWTLPLPLRALLPHNYTMHTHNNDDDDNNNNNNKSRAGIESSIESDADNCELLRRYAEALSRHGIPPLLPAVMELVEEWRNATTQCLLDGVLRRRYNFNGSAGINVTTCWVKDKGE